MGVLPTRGLPGGFDMNVPLVVGTKFCVFMGHPKCISPHSPAVGVWGGFVDCCIMSSSLLNLPRALERDYQII